MTSCRLDDVGGGAGWDGGGGCLGGRMGPGMRRGMGWRGRGVRVVGWGMSVWMGLAVMVRRSGTEMDGTAMQRMAMFIAVGGRGLDKVASSHWGWVLFCRHSSASSF